MHRSIDVICDERQECRNVQQLSNFRVRKWRRCAVANLRPIADISTEGHVSYLLRKAVSEEATRFIKPGGLGSGSGSRNCSGSGSSPNRHSWPGAVPVHRYLRRPLSSSVVISTAIAPHHG